MILKHRKNPFFYISIYIIIKMFTKIWIVYIFIILSTSINILWTLSRKNPEIIIKNNKTSLYISCYKIKIIKMWSETRISKNLIFFYIFIIIFNFIVGTSYRIIKLSIVFFDTSVDEFYSAKIYKKKIKISIISKYIKNVIKNFIFTEFIKKIYIPNEIIIDKFFIKKRIKISR